MVDDFGLLPEHQAHCPPQRERGERFVRGVQEKNLPHQPTPASRLRPCLSPGLPGLAGTPVKACRGRAPGSAESVAPATRTSSGRCQPQLVNSVTNGKRFALPLYAPIRGATVLVCQVVG
ncbi:hypothetical protein GCM10022221_38520 [Actinocorallia aurea]